MFEKVFLRFITYPFCFFAIYGGVNMIFSPAPKNYNSFLEGKAIFAGFGLIIICSIYLISDLLILIRDFKKRN